MIGSIPDRNLQIWRHNIAGDIIYCEELKREHCWHRDNQMLLSGDPPVGVDYCCFCGKTKQIEQFYTTLCPEEHGPHLKGYVGWPDPQKIKEM